MRVGRRTSLGLSRLPAIILLALLLVIDGAVGFASGTARHHGARVVILDNGSTSVNSRPHESGPFKRTDLVELKRMDPNLVLDIRYATANNFSGRPMYREARAFLQRPAAEALKRVHRRLRGQGYGLIVYDGYRPWSVTKHFWDITPEEKKEFVADPALGSRHNRGCAVDLSLLDLATSRPVEMPTDYDDFTSRSYPGYAGGTERSRRNRDLLRKAMEAEGFSVYPTEWWHFDYRGWQRYPILDVPFDRVRPVRRSYGADAYKGAPARSARGL